MSAPFDPTGLHDDPDRLWRRLADAAAARTPGGLKTLTLATIAPDGSPQARTVILRHADPAARTIAWHADRTSPKVDELLHDPRAVLVGWDADARLQLRLTATAALHLDDAIADAAWAAQPPGTLAIYRQTLTSGARIARPEDAVQADAPQRARFAWVVAQVAEIDWLHLGETRHARGHLMFGPGGAFQHSYLVP